MNNGCYLSKGTVHNLISCEKYAAINELITKVSQKTKISGIKNLESAIINREREQSTGLGDGVAIAHGKTEYARQPLVFLGVSRQGINYDAPDGKPVHLLFIIVNHPHYQQEYITVLSSIARLVSNIQFRNTLLALPCVAEIEARLGMALSHARRQSA